MIPVIFTRDLLDKLTRFAGVGEDSRAVVSIIFWVAYILHKQLPCQQTS